MTHPRSLFDSIRSVGIVRMRFELDTIAGRTHVFLELDNGDSIALGVVTDTASLVLLQGSRATMLSTSKLLDISNAVLDVLNYIVPASSLSMLIASNYPSLRGWLTSIFGKYPLLDRIMTKLPPIFIPMIPTPPTYPTEVM